MVNAQDWTGAQAAVIGSALIDPDCIPLILSSCAEADLSGEWRTLFAAIRDMTLRGQTVDPVTLLNATGEAYRETVRAAIERTPSSANAAEYAKVCKEQSRLARLGSMGLELSGATTLEAARETLQKMQAVSVEQEAARVVSMTDALTAFVDAHQKGEHEYVKLGFPALDERLAVDPGDVLVLGGYPSDGKTALMLQWCWKIAEELPVGIFSFETSAAKLTDRIVTQALPALRFTDVKRSKLGSADWKAVMAASVEITKRKVEIVEAAGMTAADILGVSLARGFRCIAIDYVQLVTPGTVRKGGTRAEEVAEISKTLALMARRHKLLVIELSQLSRPQKSPKGKTPAPTLSSLRESGQLEQDADVVALLYRISDAENARRELYIAKNKEGRTGKVELAFNGEAQRFSYVARGEDIPRELATAQRNRYERKKNGSEQMELPE
jgi:replicative DNA helicase